MGRRFIKRITTGFKGGHYRLDLGDRVVVFCKDGFHVDGTLLGLCDEGLLVGSDNADMWLNASDIIAAARVNSSGGDSDGREDCVTPPPNGKRKAKEVESDGSSAMNRVFANGTR